MNTTWNVLATAVPEGPGVGGGIMVTVLYFGFFILMMWVLLIRPQKKREKETVQMQSSIKPGDSVLTMGGLYGKVVDVANDAFIIEFGLNKGVRIPVQKDRIAGKREPDLTLKKVEE